MRSTDLAYVMPPHSQFRCESRLLPKRHLVGRSGLVTSGEKRTLRGHPKSVVRDPLGDMTLWVLHYGIDVNIRCADHSSRGGRQEDAMSIIRLIHIKIDPSETETAERIWKTKCASLMISQIRLYLRKSCCERARSRRVHLLSEWRTEADIEPLTRTASRTRRLSATRAP